MMPAEFVALQDTASHSMGAIECTYSVESGQVCTGVMKLGLERALCIQKPWRNAPPVKFLVRILSLPTSHRSAVHNRGGGGERERQWNL